MPSIRSFIAIDTAEKVKDKIAELSEKLRATDADVRWEPREKYHITLKFLGSVEEKSLELLASRLAGHLMNFSPFRLIYHTVGCFPNLHHPRVIWVGAEDEEGTLVRIQEKAEEFSAALGIEKEDRKFHPHVTLGRVKGSKNLKALIAELEQVSFEPQSSVVHEVLLMKSELKPSGSVYSVLQRFSLRKTYPV